MIINLQTKVVDIYATLIIRKLIELIGFKYENNLKKKRLFFLAVFIRIAKYEMVNVKKEMKVCRF